MVGYSSKKLSRGKKSIYEDYSDKNEIKKLKDIAQSSGLKFGKIIRSGSQANRGLTREFNTMENWQSSTRVLIYSL